MTIDNLESLAEELAARLNQDVKLATHREEHIRVTARANEAYQLLNGIKNLKAASSQ